jgi:hypothetical protein
MTTLAPPIPTSSPSANNEPKARAPRRRHADLILYAVIAVLVFAAWQFSKRGYFKSGDDIGYWVGVAGATMMLLLFSYPLRKYLRFTRSWGKVKWWFVAHMVLGIGGPLLILLHSTFHLGSLNAAVAMFSMLIVCTSGVVGRFLYLRIHRNLHGERNNLSELKQRAGLVEGEMTSRFHFAPDVAMRLLAFEAKTLATDARSSALAVRLFVLPIRQRLVGRVCVRELNARLRVIAKERAWSDAQLNRRRRQSTLLTREFLAGVVRVAQFTAYERLFALWHLLHAPFVYLLILTACFHVFAVHAY